MYAEPIQNFRELPVLGIFATNPENNRRRTDVCSTLFAIIFALSMFIGACVSLNREHLSMISYPTDSDGRRCGRDLPDHSYVYFTNPTSANLANRICVSVCPQQGDKSLACAPTKTIQCNDSSIMIYNSTDEVNRLGGFCIPSDKYLYSRAIHNYNVKDKINFMKSYDNVKVSLAVALGLGIVYLLLAQCLPKTMSWLSIVLAAIGCVALVIVLLSDHSPSLAGYTGLVNFLLITLLMLAFGLVLNLIWNRYSIKVSGIFLDYASRMVRQNYFILWWVLVFLLFSFGLLALTIFQYLAFSSRGPPYLESDDIYWNVAPFNLGTILCLIEFLWGLSFLRDAFNYIITGHTVRWYFIQSRVEACTPFYRLLKFNFGSIVGGSLLNAVFFLPDLLLSVLRVTFPLIQCNQAGCCVQICQCLHRCCFCFFNLFEIVRSDAYAYIHLAGTPYCDAARQCEYLCRRSRLFTGSQSTNKVNSILMQVYRLSAHLLLCSIILCISYAICRSKLIDNDVSIKALLCVLLGSLLIIPYWLCLHADAADALMITYSAEEHLEEMEPNYSDKAPKGLRRDLETMARSRPSIVYS